MVFRYQMILSLTRADYNKPKFKPVWVKTRYTVLLPCCYTNISFTFSNRGLQKRKIAENNRKQLSFAAIEKDTTSAQFKI